MGSGYHQIRWWAAQESNLRPPACKIGFAAPRSAANMNESIAYPQHKLARKVPRYPQKPRKTHDFAGSAAHLGHSDLSSGLLPSPALFMWMVITLSGAHRFSARVCANCPSLEYCQIDAPVRFHTPVLLRRSSLPPALLTSWACGRYAISACTLQ